MKHLRIFESKNSEKLVLDAMTEYDRICDLMRDFINLENLNGNIKVAEVLRYYIEKDISTDVDAAIFADIIEVGKYHYDGDDTIMITDLEKLYRFIDNPEQYKNSKKYNL
jgi:hypothetical protein